MTDAWLIGRQPILDRARALHGYELLFRSADRTAAHADPSVATAQVLVGALSGFGLTELLGEHLGFVNVGRDLLFSDTLELLPRGRIVLELLETVRPDAAVVQRCRALRAAGFALALDDHLLDPAFEPLYELVEVVKVDLLAGDERQIEETVEGLRRHPLRLLAEKVETPEQHRRCLDLGFELFQGFYFARPAVLERRRLGLDEARILDLLRLLGQDAEIGEIDQTFRRTPGLTYKLLVLVNSVAFGSRQHISTVRQAITMLGRSQLRRWLQLALFVAEGGSTPDDPLVDLAAVRATLVEHLAPLHPGLAGQPEAAERGFMAGILSLLDRIFDVNMREVVDALNLAPVVSEALLGRGGPLGQLLSVAEQLERLELDAAAAELYRAGIPGEQAFSALRLAYAWRSSFG